MSGDSSTRLQLWIDRLRNREPGALQDLLAHAHGRLHGLVKKILHQDFPRLAAAHETMSVLNEAALRLLGALDRRQSSDKVPLADVREFLCYSAAVIRHVLLELARKHGRKNRELLQGDRQPAHSAGDASPPDPADTTFNPQELANWTEFHQKADGLPEEERHVFDLYFYQGLTQAEISTLLEISEKEVSRRWLRAARKLSPLSPEG